MNKREQRLTAWMQQYGDQILRTCYLLCHDRQRAHQLAQRVFIDAYPLIYSMPQDARGTWLLLLRLACQRCRARPDAQTVAVLCLYNGLSIEEAAGMLHISPSNVQQLLSDTHF